MTNRIIVGLIVLAAIVEGLAPGAVPSDLLPLALVVLGLVYAGMAVDPDDATAYLVVALAVGGAASTDVLSNIQMIGSQVDAILDQASIALYGGVVTVFILRTVNHLKG